MKRRVLLERLGAVTAAGALAGCLDETTDGPGSGGDDEDGGTGENETDEADDGGNGDEENETDERENETSDRNETDENDTADRNETEGSENDTAEENDTEDDGDDGSGEEAGEDGGSGAQISDEEITTRNADCGEGNEASIAFADGAVEIEGSLMASDPCHEAVLADVSVEDDELELTVGTEQVDEGMCAQCIARVDYEATVRFESESPSIAAVRHEGDEGTEEVARERREQ